MYNVICADERGVVVYTRTFAHKIMAIRDADYQTAPTESVAHDICVVTYWFMDELRTTYTAREGKEVTE